MYISLLGVESESSWLDCDAWCVMDAIKALLLWSKYQLQQFADCGCVCALCVFE